MPTIPQQLEADPTSPTEGKETPSTENLSHVLGLKWNHSTDTIVVSRGTNPEVNQKKLKGAF